MTSPLHVTVSVICIGSEIVGKDTHGTRFGEVSSRNLCNDVILGQIVNTIDEPDSVNIIVVAILVSSPNKSAAAHFAKHGSVCLHMVVVRIIRGHVFNPRVDGLAEHDATMSSTARGCVV